MVILLIHCVPAGHRDGRLHAAHVCKVAKTAPNPRRLGGWVLGYSASSSPSRVLDYESEVFTGLLLSVVGVVDVLRDVHASTITRDSASRLSCLLLKHPMVQSLGEEYGLQYANAPTAALAFMLRDSQS